MQGAVNGGIAPHGWMRNAGTPWAESAARITVALTIP
jgi:hypothetical protein